MDERQSANEGQKAEIRNPEVIKFYRTGDQYGEFSNFSNHPIEIDDQTWPSVEHYYQAQKFNGSLFQAQIRDTISPKEAAILGRSLKQSIRQDWDDARDEVMYRAIKTKFTQYPDLANMLIDTGNAYIVEHTSNDDYWGDGGDGSGQNMLGQLLMQVRDEILIENKYID